MKYTKTESVQGNWVKGSEIKSGTKCKLVSEVKPIASQFKEKDGSTKMQDVGRIVFSGSKDEFNISINRASMNALVDAFGEDSVGWVGNVLTVETEKVRVAGKAVTAVYLIPEGYHKIDDENGYARIVKEGDEVQGEPEEIPPDDIPF